MLTAEQMHICVRSTCVTDGMNITWNPEPQSKNYTVI